MSQLTYNHFVSKSMKARICWVQRVLNLPVTGKRDKTTIKALKKFQEDNGLGGNAVVCEKTFNLLCNAGGDKINIDMR